MKRIIAILLSIVMALSFCVSGYAENDNTQMKTYYIRELGMSIDLPIQYTVFTRDMSPNDPLFASVNTTYNNVMDTFNFAGQYLDASKTLSLNGDIIIFADTSRYDNLSTLSDSVVNEMKSSMEYISNSISYYTLISSEIYRNNGLTFIRLHEKFKNDKTSYFSVRYHTIVDGLFISIYFTDFNTKNEETIMQSIIDSIVFDSMSSSENDSGLSSFFSRNNDNNVFCRMCGESIPSDSNFCPKCGAKVK